MMYKLLIVEDEEWIRRGIIQSIDWNTQELDLVGDVSNGEQAIQIMEQQTVDIVLTDMKMPVCDGRTLLQYIKNREYDCEVIVLSEYTDFEYTRQAIQSHVAEYLLKPVDPAQLNDVLNNATGRLTSRRLSHSENLDPIDSIFLATISRTSQQHFESVCKQNEKAFTDKCVSIMCIQPEIQYTTGYFESLTVLANEAPYPTRLYLYHDSLNVVCLFSIIPAPYTAGAYLQNSAWIRSLFARHKEMWGGDVRIGVCEALASPYSFREGLSSSLSALQFLRSGHGDIVYSSSVSEYKSTQIESIIGEQQITDLLSRCKKEDAAKLRQMLFDSLVQCELLYIPSMRQLLSNFALTLEKCSNKAGYPLNITSAIGENYIDRITRIEWLSEADSFLREVLDEAFISIAAKRALTTADIVEEVIKRIETQYMDDINLMQISQQYHINYVHLSRQFKERTGELFSDFLLRVRMTKAKEFIEKLNFSEKDTASLVGYSNPYYFSSSYRKYFNSKEKGADNDAK